jgi:hypothetical protein
MIVAALAVGLPLYLMPIQGGGALLLAGPRYHPLPGRQAMGTAGGDEPEPPVATAGQARRSAPTAGRGVPLVH